MASPADLRPARPRSGCAAAALIAAASAVLGTVGLIHIVRTCHDTDASSNASINFLLWPIVTPVLWIVEAALIGGAFLLSARLAKSRKAWILLSAVATAVIVIPLTWWYWSFGVSSLSTGLYSTHCPGGAPAWWPEWLPLYSP